MPTASSSEPLWSRRCAARWARGGRDRIASRRSPGRSSVSRGACAASRSPWIEANSMNWISNVVPPKIRSFLRRDTPENLWIKCPESGELVFHKDLESNLHVVPGSGHHMRMPAKARLDSLFDDAFYEELPTPEVPL